MGGGGVDFPQRSFGSEWPTIKKGYMGQENQYFQYAQRDPLLSQAYPFALQGMKDIGQLTDPLRALLGGLPATFGGYQRQLAGYDPTLANLVKTQQGVYSGLQPTLQTQGALTQEQGRQATQDVLSQFAGRGNVFNQASAAAFLNRDQYRQQRFSNALNQALGLSGSIAGLTGARAGLVGQQAGLTGQQAGLTSGLASGIQGLRSGALQNVLGAQRAGVQSFSQLTNPILAYIQDIFSSNQNAAAAQSIAGANKSGGALGGAASGIGSIIGAVLPLLAASDKRFKENIRSTGEKTIEGIPIKAFSYKGDKRRFIGVVAQDVEKKMPSAVLTHPVTGHKMIDLTKINVPFREITPLRREAA
jgi:endosialidase-like protein